MSSEMQDMGGRDFVGIKALAKRWQTTKTTVRRALRDGGVRAYRFSGKDGGIVRYRKDDVEKFVEQCVE